MSNSIPFINKLSSYFVPYFVGVSGHRDLIAQDEERIRLDICDQLSRVEAATDPCQCILFSALASGADQWVAEEALRRNWLLIAVFPMLELDFLLDFDDDPEGRRKFDQLRGKCHGVIELPWSTHLDPDITNARDQQYRNHGNYLARFSQAVIALWDGLPADQQGACGTSYVVELCLRGLAPIDGEILATPEKTSLFHIPVRRQKKTGHVSTVHISVDKDFEHVAKGMRMFSARAIKLRLKQASIRKISKGYVLPYEFEETLDGGSKFLLDAYADADTLANLSQVVRNRVVMWASIFAVAGAVFQAISGIFNATHWLVLYGGAVAIAYGLFLYFFKLRSTEDHYLEFRALAEGYRVAVFWRLAGVNKFAAEHYLQFIKSDVGWVRDALRSVVIYAATMFDLPTPNMEVVRKYWVDDQTAYFVNKTPLNEYKAALWHRVADGAMLVGGVLVVAGGLTKFMNIDQWIELAVSSSSAMAFVVGGIVSGYSAVMGYKEQSIYYAMTAHVFKNAQNVLERNPGKLEQQQACLFELGVFALTENAEWLLAHRRNSFKLST